MRRDVLFGKVKNNKGFTLLETLVVVAIMTILTAVSFLAVGDMKGTIKMTELDDYAKSIYLEAQNRLSAIEIEGGMPQFYNELTADYGDRFLADNAPVDYIEADEEWKNICYITRDEAIAVGLMPQNAYSSSMSGNYILELNAQSGDVYGAFYWESEDDISYANVIETLASRNRTDRVDSELGYYGGTSMNTLALLENAPANAGDNWGGTGGDRGGFFYYEKYEDGTYGVLAIGDDETKTVQNTYGYDYNRILDAYVMDNTLRNEECVTYGFATFTGVDGYWRIAQDMNNWWLDGAIQDWPRVEEKYERMPNIMTQEILQNSYTLYKIYEHDGPLGEPKTDDYWGWNGDNRYYVKFLIAYCDEPNGWYMQLTELTQFFNKFLANRYDELSAT